MPTKPKLHVTTARQVAAIIAERPQGVLLVSEDTLWAQELARYVAGELGVISEIVGPTDAKGVSDETGQIRVQQVRALYETTRSRSRDTQVVVIDHADTMTHQAQNAFLKFLEEPNASVCFVLVARRRDALLPTVISRVQSVFIRPLSQKASLELLAREQVSDMQTKQILFLANGLYGEMLKLARESEYFTEQATLMKDARDFLRASIYERVVLAHTYGADRTKALLLVGALARIFKQMAVRDEEQKVISKIDDLLMCEQRLRRNGNPRLTLLRFVV